MKVSRGGVLVHLNKLIDAQKIRRNEGIPLDAFEIVSVGELNANKNHKIVIEAISKLKEKEKIHYIVAGTGNNKELLEKLASELQVNLHLLGYRNDIPILYKSADVCAFPSIREGLGMAALEGMACGLPLICSDNRGTRGYALDGENALVCPPRDIDAFAEAIDYLYQNPAFCFTMAQKAAIATKKFDVVQINQQMKEVYAIEG